MAPIGGGGGGGAVVSAAVQRLRKELLCHTGACHGEAWAGGRQQRRCGLLGDVEAVESTRGQRRQGVHSLIATGQGGLRASGAAAWPASLPAGSTAYTNAASAATAPTTTPTTAASTAAAGCRGATRLDLIQCSLQASRHRGKLQCHQACRQHRRRCGRCRPRCGGLCSHAGHPGPGSGQQGL